MDRETCRRINCPYGAILVPEKKAVALFNREYEPLGFPRLSGLIPDGTRLSWFLNVDNIKDIGMTDYLLELRSFSYDNTRGKEFIHQEGPFAGCAAYHIFFYNDGCIPTSSSSALENYFDRVNRFLRFIGKPELNVCMKSIMTKKQRYNHFHVYY